MNPIYKFTLSANGGTERAAFPVYRDDLAKEYELQSNQEFYRAKLSGKLSFVRDDYNFIVSQTFDTQFGLKIFISYDAGETWTEYWKGQFWKTDCEFDNDNKNLTVTPTVVDQYTNILAGIEKEFNLIELAPEIVPVNLDKRPMLQFYVPGTTVVGCYLSGMWWEQQCEATNDFDVLYNTCHFYLSQDNVIAEITQSGTPTLPKSLFGTSAQGHWLDGYSMKSQGYELVIAPDGIGNYDYTIQDVATHTPLWAKKTTLEPTPNYSVQLNAVSGSGATGTVDVYVRLFQIFSRLVCDKETQDTYDYSTEDIVPNNRNYRYVIQANCDSAILLSSYFSQNPTEWGLFQPGAYFMEPPIWIGKLYPIARNWWGSFSLWLNPIQIPAGFDTDFREAYTLRDSFPIASVISVLLGQIAPELTHEETTDYSQFLYGTNPITQLDQRILITPKSNVISLGYDQPAQKAPTTLQQVMNMLRDCFRCYWFIDNDNKFRIEHISYFMNGGTYTPGDPVFSYDLTTEQNTRNGKKLAFGTSKFKFDKPEMAARYQFGWMDDVTQLFEGNPIDIVSKYVNPENIQQIDVANFTSDIDYILLNPGEISKDGFVLLSATGKLLALNQFTFANNTLIGASPAGTPFESMLTPLSTRITNTVLISINGSLSFSMPSGYEMRVWEFDINGNYTGTSTAWVTEYSGNNVVKVAITIRHSDGSDISTTDIPNVFLSINGGIKLPYDNITIDGLDHNLQNVYVAFVILQIYYFFDMPAKYFKYNGIQVQASGIKKLKTQTIKFPCLTDPDMKQLIKTYLGKGTIQKLSINLSSRNANATLKYDTE